MRHLFVLAAATAALLASAGAASPQISYCQYPKVCPDPPGTMPNPPIQALKTWNGPLPPMIPPARVLKTANNPMPVPWPPGFFVNGTGPGTEPPPPARVLKTANNPMPVPWPPGFFRLSGPGPMPPGCWPCQVSI